MRRIGLAVVLTLSLVLYATLGVSAEQAQKVKRIGYTSYSSGPSEPNKSFDAFREAMRELGYLEGRNIVLEVRYVGRHDVSVRLRTVAAEFVRLNVDVIVAPTGQAAAAAKQATRTIPIVMASSGDAVAQGLVTSLARPGGNVTGSTLISPELSQKRLEVLREAMPNLVRVGALRCSRGAVHAREWAETQTAAAALGVQLSALVVQNIDELDGAFISAVRQRLQAVLVFDCSDFHPRAALIVDLAMTNRLPAMYPFPAYPRVGGLMSYGASQADGYRQAGAYAGRILKGEKPIDLPVMQPTKFEFVLNLKTANALGLDVPPTLLASADEAIE